MAPAVETATRQSNPSILSSLNPPPNRRLSEQAPLPLQRAARADIDARALFHRLHTRVADSEQEFKAADDLVRRRYRCRGYEIIAFQACAGQGSGGSELTLLAGAGPVPTGTLTIRSGDPEDLHAYASYAAELHAARPKRGQRIGEVTRLALEADIDSKPVLAALFQDVHFLLKFHHEVRHFVIEVHPRHVPFYRRSLGFAIAGGERLCPRVSAPSVLLQVDIEEFGRRVTAFWNRVFGRAACTLASEPCLSTA